MNLNLDKKHMARKQELFKQINTLVETVGFDNLTIRKICKELDISTGTFYHYFPEKGDIAWILFSEIDNYFKTEVTQKYIDYEPDNLITFSMEYGVYVMKRGVENCRYINLAPLKNVGHSYLDEGRDIFQNLYGIFNRGVEKEQFLLTESSLEISRMFMILLRGYSTDWTKRGGNYDLVEALKKFSVLFCKGLGINGTSSFY